MSVAHIKPLTYSLPTSISGCSLWLDANDTTTITFSSGSNINTWIDKSSANNTMTSYNTPTYSNKSVYLSGTAYLSNSGPTDAINTQFFVYQTYTGNLGPLFCVQYASGNDTDGFFPNWATTGNMYLQQANGSWYMAPTLLPNQQVNIVCIQYSGNGNPINVWYNSSNIISTSQTGTISQAAYILGARLNNGGNTNYLQGQYYEVITYNSALATAQRQNIEGYLAQKWGLATNLPRFHPGLKSPLYPALIKNRILNKSKTGVFYPTSIAGCQVWLDASDPTLFSYSSGSVIQQWNDKSGNSLHAYSNSLISWQAPSYVSGNPSYVSLQPNQALYVPNFPYTTAWSVFSCMNNVSLGGRWYISPYSDLNIVLMGMAEPGNKVFSGLLAGDGDITGSHVEYTSAQNTNGTGDYSYFRDGTQIGINTIGNSIPAATVHMGIGANGAAPYDIGGTYYTYEIIFYNQYLGSNDRQTVESYLAWKWGLQSQLDASNPYKSAAPGSSSRLPMPPIFNLKRIFNPTTSVTGCVLWLDSADLTTMFQNTAGTTPVTTGGQVVQLWKDKSIKANNASSSSSSMTYSTNGIYFPGTQTTGLSLTPTLLPTGTSDSTWFFIINTTNNGTVVYMGLGGGGDLKQFYISSGYLQADKSGVGGIGGTTLANTGSNILFSCLEDNANTTLTGWQNGTQFATKSYSFNVGTPTSATIGTDLGNFAYIGYVAEVIVYNKSLNTTDRKSVENYLMGKWGIKSS